MPVYLVFELDTTWHQAPTRGPDFRLAVVLAARRLEGSRVANRLRLGGWRQSLLHAECTSLAFTITGSFSGSGACHIQMGKPTALLAPGDAVR